MTNLPTYRCKLDAALADCNAAVALHAAETAAVAAGKVAVAASAEAQAAAQVLAEQIQNEAIVAIAAVVSKSLAAVFPDPYEFEVQFNRKRGKTEARLLFRRNGYEIAPLGGAGGGAVDIAALALRLACMVLTRPVARRVLVLDEPLRFLSAEYRPAARAMIETLAKDFGCQFVFVTHVDDLKIGKVVEL